MLSTIEVKLFAILRKYEPTSAEAYPIESGASLSDLLDRLGIPEDQAKLVFINGRKAGLNTVIKDGDRVGIFPPVGGG